MKLRLALFTAGALGLAAVMAAGMRRLEPIGSYHGAYGEVLNAVAVGERNSTDVVSAVNFDYRKEWCDVKKVRSELRALHRAIHLNCSRKI